MGCFGERLRNQVRAGNPGKLGFTNWGRSMLGFWSSVGNDGMATIIIDSSFTAGCVTTSAFYTLAFGTLAIAMCFRAVAIETVSVAVAVAENLLHFLAEGRFDHFGLALAASDTANIGGVYVQLGGNTLVQTTKKCERLKRSRVIIGFVTIHDFL